MITEGQAKYLKKLINEHADFSAVLYDALNSEGRTDRTKEIQTAAEGAKRKLDNYIAKLTETGK